MNTKQPNLCPSCGKPVKEDFNVCPYCGKTIKKICHKCGKILEDDYKKCPYCGAKVKGESTRSIKVHIPDDYREKGASLVTSLGDFLLKIGRILKRITLAALENIKIFSQKALKWLKSIDWGKSRDFLKAISSKVKEFIKVAIPWLKKGLNKVWVFLRETFVRLRDFLSGLLEKKLSPEMAKKAAVGIIIAVICACFLITLILVSGPGSPNEEQIAIEPTIETLPTVDPAQQKWLVMVYADADDEILEEDMIFDVNEMEMAGSSERVQIVTQVDRFNGGFSEDGDWTSARRYFIEQDSDLTAINSPVLAELGEINMGDSQTLIDFVNWSIDTYPADRYVLILSDHGGGWTGGWTDSDPSYDYLSLNEIAYAFDELVPNLPNGNFDIVGFDACLMSQLDVYSAIAPYARYSIASEETEPATGWAYTAFLQSLLDNPAMDAKDLASIIVDTYLEQDQRFINNDARARLFQGNTDVTMQDALDLVMPSSTLTAVELAYIPEINQALNTFAYDITAIDQTYVAAARNYATSFQSVFGKDTVPSFIDLVNFTLILEQEAGTDLGTTSGAYLRELLNKAIIKNKAGKEKVGAQGMSFYFPNSDMYKNEYGGYEIYTSVNNRFMEDSLWDDFLAFHYAGVAFDPDSRTAVLPARSADVAGPGMGEIQVGTDCPFHQFRINGGSHLIYN